jgi:hypothetical protein
MGFLRSIRAADRGGTVPARQDFNLIKTDTSRKAIESRELQGPAVEGMRSGGDTDSALAFSRDRRSMTSGEVERGARQV